MSNAARPLEINITDDVLTISIGVGTLAFAVQSSDNQWPEDQYIKDPRLFAKEFSHQLNQEEEDGTTPVHLMFDNVALEALEQGAESVFDGDVQKGIKIARKLFA